MEVVMISDTHLKNNKGQLDKMLTKFQGVDILIHAGDYTEGWVLKYLQDNFNFIGVWGNNDNDVIKSVLPEKIVTQIGSQRVGVCHAHGKGKSTIERAYRSFDDDSVDIIIFGHSHKPIISTMKRVLMLNPGSLTNKRNERWFSYILINVDSQGFQVSLRLNEV